MIILALKRHSTVYGYGVLKIRGIIYTYLCSFKIKVGFLMFVFSFLKRVGFQIFQICCTVKLKFSSRPHPASVTKSSASSSVSSTGVKGKQTGLM